jgi:hypothetical protein
MPTYLYGLNVAEIGNKGLQRPSATFVASVHPLKSDQSHLSGPFEGPAFVCQTWAED